MHSHVISTLSLFQNPSPSQSPNSVLQPFPKNAQDEAYPNSSPRSCPPGRSPPASSTNDVLSEGERREASPIVEADLVYYIKRIGYTDKREASPEAEADPIFYIKRAGYGDKKREANPEAEADPIFYIKRAGYGDKKCEASPEAEADPPFYIKCAGYGDTH